MKKRNYKEENHYYVQWGVAALILLLYVVATLITYNNAMKEQAKNRVLDKITKQAIEIRGFYEGLASAHEGMAAGVAKQIANMDNIFSKKSVDAINSMAKAEGFEKIYIIDNAGAAVDNKGITYKVLNNSEEYREMLEGKRSFYIDTNASGEVVIMQSAPIQDGAELKGYILLEYKANKMKKLIEVPIFSYAIVFEDGLVAETLGDDQISLVGDNMLDAVKEMTIEDGSYTTISQAISNGRSINALLTKDNIKYYVVMQPISNTNCEIVVIAKSSIIERNIREENSATKAMVLKLVISLVVFIMLLVIIYAINRLTFSKTSMELQNKAETDLLTDLFNKISTEKKIKEYISEEGKEKTCMMCVLDIDNFKKINDTMGHAFGDEVLAALGKQIRSEFRVSDIIGRTGGDEFIIFLKDLKDDSIIMKEAERVENFFKNFTVGEYTKYSATASIGAAIYPRDAEDFESLYKAADTALYKAKNRGKNQLAFYKDTQNY